MKKINDQQFEDLAKQCPNLFQKAKLDSFDVGSGWLPLIETLCDMISYNVECTKKKILYLYESDDSAKNQIRIAELNNLLKTQIDELPVILQVKEKFGGLRFIARGSTESTLNFIDFAEVLSMKTCEWCGSPGTARSDGWTKVLCEKHHKERENPPPTFTNPIAGVLNDTY